MELKETLEHFFQRRNTKKITIKELIGSFHITESLFPLLSDVLYTLEKEGKIYMDDNGAYMHVPQNFYIRHGILHISNRNKYYVKAKTGALITISKLDLKGAKAGDVVFTEVLSQKQFYKKQFTGKIVRVVQKEEILPRNNYLCKGVIKKDYSCESYYIEQDKKRIYISPKLLSTAFVGDTVTVQVSYVAKGKYGKVIDIIERNTKDHVFEYKKIGAEYCWVPIGTAFFKASLTDCNAEFKENDRILARLSMDHKSCEITYRETLPCANNGFDEIGAIALDYGFPISFSAKVAAELEKMTSEISEEEIEKRTDLRKLETVTIDGEDAKDLDDAVSIEYDETRGYRLYVHIADVSHYVKPGTALFQEAYERGTSSYPVGFVIPMLPRKLSNEICSLHPNEDKLTRTYQIDIDLDGNIIDSKVFNSVIRSDGKLTYNKVDALLDGTKIDSDYIPYYPMLSTMSALSGLLQKKRLERGFICFETNEMEFETNEQGEPISIKERSKGQSTLLIENFMLLANQVAADYAYWLDIPLAYRNHLKPTPEKTEKLKYNVSEINRSIRRFKNVDDPKILQKILLLLCSGKPREQIVYISKIMLSQMERATYGETSMGHYGLALKNYATFTSPIRRFPDLINNISISEMVEKEYDPNLLAFFNKNLQGMCVHLSERQQAAEKFEIEIKYKMLKKYAERYYGEPLKATVVFVTKEGSYIQTENSIPGFIPKKTSHKVGEKITAKLQGITSQQQVIFDLYEKKKMVDQPKTKYLRKGATI